MIRAHSYFLPVISLVIIVLLSEPVLAKKVINLATSERAPYIGQELPNKGYVHELVTHVFERAGYEVNINFYPLARSLYLTKSGIVDGMMPTYYDSSLLTDIAYSAAFYGGNFGLMKKKSSTIPFDFNGNDSLVILFEKLKNYSIGVVRGVIISPEFEQANFLTKHLVSKDIFNLDMINFDRVDLIVIDKYTAADLVVNHRPHLIGKLEFISPFISPNKYHVAFSRKSKNYLQFTADFNQSLAEVTADGTFKKILNKHGIFTPRAIGQDEVNLTIGTVNNKDMLLMRELSTEFELLNPKITLTWKVLDENTLRKRLLGDLAISDGQFDIMTIGLYEALIWAKNDWLYPLVDLPKEYDMQDVFPVLRQGFTYNNSLYALPFYSESSMTYYRKDLFKAAHINMPENPTYNEIKEYASLLHNPKEKIYGICLRGKPGWGENIALFTTIVNTHAGKWFDNKWQPKLDSLAWQQALILYKELLTQYGPPNPTLNGYNENKQLFSDGHCAIWIDATVAAGELFDVEKSKVSAHVALANAPVVKAKAGANWFWSWALAVSKSSKNREAATKFIAWATSKNYIKQVAKKAGWIAVPPGTRKSTYQNKNYQTAAPFSNFILNTIEEVSFLDTTLQHNNYRGIQFVEIPEFPALGHQVGLNIAKVIEGKMTIKRALSQSQRLVDEQMRVSKYY